jgi:hypothetical protein
MLLFDFASQASRGPHHHADMSLHACPCTVRVAGACAKPGRRCSEEGNSMQGRAPDLADGGLGRVAAVVKGEAPRQQLMRHDARGPHIRRRHHRRAEHLWGHEPAARACASISKGHQATPCMQSRHQQRGMGTACMRSRHQPRGIWDSLHAVLPCMLGSEMPGW